MMGTEHELSVVFNSRRNPEEDLLSENYDPEVYEYRPLSLYDVPSESRGIVWRNQSDTLKILNNGSFLQEFTDRPCEIATPECSKPSELLAYSLATREIISEWASYLLENNSLNYRSVSLHERVIDSHGNTWGEHDNFSLNSDEKHWVDLSGLTPGVIWLHILTRSCVSGSGHVNNTDRGWTLSQKLPTVKEINNKTWGSTGFFGNQSRIEIRCSDKNVSQWSHMMRIGSMALILALARTGYKTNDLGFDEEDVFDQKYIGTHDRLHVNKDGEVKFTHDAKTAISIQKSLAEACLDLAIKEGFDDEYKFIAKEWFKHCEKLELEIYSQDSVDLSNFLHTDWASKFYIIQQKISNEYNNGFKKPFGYEASAQDLIYDRILFDRPMYNSKIYRIDGHGYKLNKRFKQRVLIGEKAVKNAMISPPNTRAKLRVELIKDLENQNCDIEYVEWDIIEWLDSNRHSFKHYFDD